MLRLAVYWYIQAISRSGGLEGALVLGQVALELLGSACCVELNPIVSAGGFARLPASDRIRLLLSFAKIPLRLPVELKTLCDVACANDWADGPEAIVAIRNAVVHRTATKIKLLSDVSGRARYDAWLLTIHYIELCILHLIRYNGPVANRISAQMLGQVESVPWMRGDVAS
ncbi:MAG: hypothetical protein V3R24_00710 [Gemmatimonadales bacterium]